MEVETLRRQWLLLRLLSARRRGATIRELATEFSVSEKTIRRDLGTLSRVGFPLNESIGPHGRKSWRIDAAESLMGLSFDLGEIAALYLGRRFMEPLAGTFLWESAQSAFKKIRVGLGTNALEYLEKLATVFYQTSVGASDYSGMAALIDDLMVCIEDCCVVHLLYRSLAAQDFDTVPVEPLGLVYHRGALYLVAFSQTRQELRHYKLDRIKSCEPTKIRFERPAEFNLPDHLASSFGVYQKAGQLLSIKVRFSADVSRYVQEHKWHHSQQLTESPDGSLIATFQLSDTTEIRSWILSFGSRAQVLEPISLIDAITQELNQLVAKYNSTTTQTLQHTTTTQGSQP